MKKLSILLLTILLASPSYADELSVEEAMAMMKSSAAAFLKGEYTKVDASGIDQYVDATVTNVYGFSDFSFGSLLPFFEEYLHFDPATSYERTTKKKMKLLEFAKNNQSMIAAYAAQVDFIGETKFHEKLNFSMLAFYDSKGNIIAVRPSNYNRQDYKENLCRPMRSKIESILEEQYDPLFLPKDYWISDYKSSTEGKYTLMVQWCYELSKEKPTGDGIQRGPFKAMFYQNQKGSISTIKAIVEINGEYVWDENGIEFSYHNSWVELKSVNGELVNTWDPGDYTDIDDHDFHYLLIQGASFKKKVRASSDIPKEFKIVDENSFIMSTPIDGDVFTFTKQN